MPSSLILVCVIPSARDLEIARLLGWYRIPFKSAPKVVDVDYLAFYQTNASAPGEAGKINYCAQVRGHELTTRAEIIKDEPDHPRAHEEYFKISIGPLTPLPHPIEATNWKRITFFYTTGEYLLQAKAIQELVVHQDERTTLWRSLRERLEMDHTAELELVDPLDPQITEWLGMLYLNGNGINKGD